MDNTTPRAIASFMARCLEWIEAQRNVAAAKAAYAKEMNAAAIAEEDAYTAAQWKDFCVEAADEAAAAAKYAADTLIAYDFYAANTASAADKAAAKTFVVEAKIAATQATRYARAATAAVRAKYAAE